MDDFEEFHYVDDVLRVHGYSVLRTSFQARTSLREWIGRGAMSFITMGPNDSKATTNRLMGTGVIGLAAIGLNQIMATKTGLNPLDMATHLMLPSGQ